MSSSNVNSEELLMAFLMTGKLEDFSIDNTLPEITQIMGPDCQNPEFWDFLFDDNFEVFFRGNETCAIKIIFTPVFPNVPRWCASWYSYATSLSLNEFSEFLGKYKISHEIQVFSNGSTIVILGSFGFVSFDEDNLLGMIRYDKRGFQPTFPVLERKVKMYS